MSQQPKIFRSKLSVDQVKACLKYFLDYRTEDLKVMHFLAQIQARRPKDPLVDYEVSAQTIFKEFGSLESEIYDGSWIIEWSDGLYKCSQRFEHLRVSVLKVFEEQRLNESPLIHFLLSLWLSNRKKEFLKVPASIIAENKFHPPFANIAVQRFTRSFGLTQLLSQHLLLMLNHHTIQTWEKVRLAPGTFTQIPLGLAFDVPEGYAMLLRLMSPLDKQLLMNEKTIDCGESEEAVVSVFNPSSSVIKLKEGDAFLHITVREVVKENHVVNFYEMPILAPEPQILVPNTTIKEQNKRKEMPKKDSGAKRLKLSLSTQAKRKGDPGKEPTWVEEDDSLIPVSDSIASLKSDSVQDEMEDIPDEAIPWQKRRSPSPPPTIGRPNLRSRK